MAEVKKDAKLDFNLNDLAFGISLGEGKQKLYLVIDNTIIYLRMSFKINKMTIIGAFGNVRVGWPKNNKHNQYAIKIMKKAEIISSKHVDHIENEKKILEKI